MNSEKVETLQHHKRTSVAGAWVSAAALGFFLSSPALFPAFNEAADKQALLALDVFAAAAGLYHLNRIGRKNEEIAAAESAPRIF